MVAKKVSQYRIKASQRD